MRKKIQNIYKKLIYLIFIALNGKIKGILKLKFGSTGIAFRIFCCMPSEVKCPQIQMKKDKQSSMPLFQYLHCDLEGRLTLRFNEYFVSDTKGNNIVIFVYRHCPLALKVNAL